MSKNVSQAFDKVIEQLSQKERIKNGQVVTGSCNTRKYYYLRECLSRFTNTVVKRDFETITFTDIDKKFLQQYVDYLEGRNVADKLRLLKHVFISANVNVTIFDSVEFKSSKRKTGNVTYSMIEKIQNMDRSALSLKEQLYIDLFLFGLYSGGSTITEMASLKNSSVCKGRLYCERIGSAKTAIIPVIEPMKTIIARYREKCFGDYLLPVLTNKHITTQQQHERIERITAQTNKTLKKVCHSLRLQSEITVSMSRRVFIEYMIIHRIPLEMIAENVGCSVETILRYCEKMKPCMN